MQTNYIELIINNFICWILLMTVFSLIMKTIFIIHDEHNNSSKIKYISKIAALIASDIFGLIIFIGSAQSLLHQCTAPADYITLIVSFYTFCALGLLGLIFLDKKEEKMRETKKETEKINEKEKYKKEEYKKNKQKEMKLNAGSQRI